LRSKRACLSRKRYPQALPFSQKIVPLTVLGISGAAFRYSYLFSETASDGGGRMGRGGLNVSGIPCRSRPNKKGGLEPKVRKGRNIDGEKPSGSLNIGTRQHSISTQNPVGNKKPEGGCIGKFPGKADGTIQPGAARPPAAIAWVTFQ
jgi:hypothetical protein